MSRYHPIIPRLLLGYELLELLLLLLLGDQVNLTWDSPASSQSLFHGGRLFNRVLLLLLLSTLVPR